MIVGTIIPIDTDGKPVDIYIKADLSEIFTLSHGEDFVVPSKLHTL